MHSFSLVKSILSRVSSMKIRLLAVFSAFLVASAFPPVASAQDESPFPSTQDGGQQSGQNTQGPDTSETATPNITVSRSACKALVKHVPDDDVAYTPGVDVRGNKVVGADLNGGSNILKSLPKEIEFPVTIDFFEYAGISVPDGVSGDQSIGKITYRNGRVYFNDQQLGDEAYSAELIEACRKAGFR